MNNRVAITVSRALPAALLALALPAEAACVVVGTCSPTTQAALQTDIRLSNGAVLKPGREPPSTYYCSDLGLAAEQAAGRPAPNSFELQYRDQNTNGAANVRARLIRKSLASGAVSDVVRVGGPPNRAVVTAQAQVNEAWDLGAYAYFVAVELSTPAQQVEAHTVCLLAR